MKYLNNPWYYQFSDYDTASSSSSSESSGSDAGSKIVSSVASGALTGIVGGIVGLAGNAITGLFGKSASGHNRDHQNNIMNQWNSGDKNGALQYLQSYVSGVGSEARDHINNLKAAFSKAMLSKSEKDASDYNNYLKSFVDGVGAPLNVDILTAFAGLRYITNYDIGLTGSTTSSNSTPQQITSGSILKTQSITTDASGNPIVSTKPNYTLIIIVGIIVAALLFYFLRKK